jgi:hypothetical protein
LPNEAQETSAAASSKFEASLPPDLSRAITILSKIDSAAGKWIW